MGALLNALWPAGGAEPGNPLALGAQALPSLRAEGSGRSGSGPRMGGCIEIASPGWAGQHWQGSRRKRAFLSFTVSSVGAKLNNRDLPLLHRAEAKCVHPDLQADAPCPPSLINV